PSSIFQSRRSCRMAFSLSLTGFEILLGRGNMLALDASRQLPARLFAGRLEYAGLLLDASKRRSAAYNIELQGSGPWVESQSGLVPSIRPGELILAPVEMKFVRRGVHALPPIVACSEFPFGIVRRFKELGQDSEILAYPEVRPLDPIVSRSIGLNDAYRRSGLGDDMSGLKEYSPGEDSRLICWKVSARHSKLISKETSHGEESGTFLFLDNAIPENEAGWEDAFEEAVSLCASIVWAFTESGQKVAFASHGRYFPTSAHNNIWKILEHLAHISVVSVAKRTAGAVPRIAGSTRSLTVRLRRGRAGRARAELCLDGRPIMTTGTTRDDPDREGPDHA
ncbi:DUF58 domain-containing protein, partial [Candidatus Hydrogenedentota bacterium]